MKKRLIGMIAACFLVSTGSAGGADDSSLKGADNSDRMEIALKASRWNGGAIGNATFLASGEASRVNIIMGGISTSVSRPVRIYTYIYPGTCENLGEAPVYELNDVKTTRRTGTSWQAAKRIPAALRSLVASDHALVIRSTPPDGNRDLYCGDIR